MTSKLQVTTSVPTEIHLTREFNAPRHLVVKAMTTPELLKRWLGARRAEVVTCEVDARVGGAYRYVFRSQRDGHTFTLSGVYHELSDERIVHTERFEDNPAEARITVTLREHAGKTTMTMVIACPSQAVRDMMLATGMTDGMSDAYDDLEAMLATLSR